jgi:hypothetical protein
MSLPGHPQGCGCCAGVQPSAPQVIANRPSLPAIAYRIGTYGTFKETALSALSTALRPALRGLQTRLDDDFSVAFLDAWAVVAEILTFYQERIANEGYLRTATERSSLVGLAQLIGYQLAPGVAAATPLTFLLDDRPGAPTETLLDVGTRVQSVPGPGEKPQTFETVEAVKARPPWSAMAAQTTEVRLPAKNDTSIVLDGIATGLKVGDGVAFIGEGTGTVSLQKAEFQILTSVETDANANTTRVSWHGGLGNDYQHVFAFDARASLFGASAPQWQAMSFDFRYNYVYGVPPPTAEKPKDLPPDWPGFTIHEIANDSTVAIEVDGYQPQVKPDGYAALSSIDQTIVFLVASADPHGLSRFTVSSKTTRVGLLGKDSGDLKKFDQSVRETLVYAASRELAIAAQPITSPLPTDRVPLETGQPQFPVQRSIIVAGKPIGVKALVALQGLLLATQTLRAIQPGEVLASAAARLELSFGSFVFRFYTLTDEAGETLQLITLGNAQVQWVPAPAFAEAQSELAVVKSVDPDPHHTVLHLESGLGNDYDRATVVVSGNVARATHGETVSEILGGGDAAAPYQRFTLKQSPVTFVSAPTPSGAASTLVVRANDVAWSEVSALYGHGPRERVFVATRDDSDVMTVRFGDGHAGARPPSGSANVRATYRKGIGAAGNVAANSITLLQSRPLGLSGVNNPLPASGGQDPQTVDGARRNAPMTVMTLDRAVSLSDYESFARTFAGVAKALATWSWNGRSRGVFLTVAGSGGAAIPADSDTLKNLVGALVASGDPYVPLRAQSYRPATFHVKLRVKLDPAYDPAAVLPAVEAALHAAFSFDARDFGQPVSISSVYAVVQLVAGVTAARIDALYRSGDPVARNQRLAAMLPTPGAQAGTMLAAELLTLAPDPLTIEPLTDGVAP